MSVCIMWVHRVVLQTSFGSKTDRPSHRCPAVTLKSCANDRLSSQLCEDLLGQNKGFKGEQIRCSLWHVWCCMYRKPFTINQHHWIQLVYSKGYILVQKSYRLQYNRSACRTDMLHAQLETCNYRLNPGLSIQSHFWSSTTATAL